MLDNLSKLIYAGFGAVSMTRQRAEELFQECLRRGEAQKQDQSGFVKDLMDAADRARRDMDKIVSEHVDRVVEKMKFATRQDLARIEEKLDKLLGQR